jgi:hypothetical protein
MKWKQSKGKNDPVTLSVFLAILTVREPTGCFFWKQWPLAV